MPAAISVLADQVLREAAARLGEHEEGGPNQGHIVEEVCQPFLSPDRFARMYEKGELEWCAAFACYCWWRVWPGIRPVVSLSATTLWERLSARGWTWQAAGGELPGPGDFIFFVRRSKDGDGPGPHLRHVGLVRSCDGKNILTIEGNAYSGRSDRGPHGEAGVVRNRTYVCGDGQIYGFGRVVPEEG